MKFLFMFLGVLKVAESSVGATSYEDRWVWSIDNDTGSPQKDVTLAKSALVNQKSFVSKPYKPEFFKPGRRISEAKCLEYEWVKNKRIAMNSLIIYQTIGGEPTAPGEFPHMGALGWRVKSGFWLFKCGCTLISEKFALTAAHCSKSPIHGNIVNSRPEVVRFGTENIYRKKDTNGQIDAEIERIIVHPLYSSPKKYNDIALIELRWDLSFNLNIQPACLWKNFNTIRLSATATVTGWGVYELMSRKQSSDLQAAEVDIIDSWLCDWLMRPYCNRHWCGIQDHQICAGKLSGGVDACQGDSGGPLQVKVHISQIGYVYFDIGVTSFGVDCAQPNLPSVYPRVSSFLDWIESIVWPESEND